MTDQQTTQLKEHKRFLKRLNQVHIVDFPEKNSIFDKIPGGTYKIVQPPMGQMYLEQIENFKVPGKWYGDVNQKLNRIKTSYHTREGNLGILLHGQSSSGKSMLSKIICKEFCEQDIPVFVIDDSSVKAIPRLIDMVNQPCVFFLDEYEKMFDERGDQNFLLSILDGIYNTKHIFLLTANETYKINEYMFNRPGRILYNWEYTSLPQETIEEYLADHLVNKNKMNQVLEVLLTVHDLSFDILSSFTEECNIFDEDPVELIKGFNVKVSTKFLYSRFNYKVFLGKIELDDVISKPDYYITGGEFSLEGLYNNQFINIGTYNFVDKNDSMNYFDLYAQVKDLRIKPKLVEVLFEFTEEQKADLKEYLKENMNEEDYQVLTDAFEKDKWELKYIFTEKENKKPKFLQK